MDNVCCAEKSLFKNVASYKMIFFVFFFVLFLLYFFDMANLLYGNHDTFKKAQIYPFFSQTGQFGIDIYRVLVSYGETLPVFVNIVFYCCLSATVIIFLVLFCPAGNNFLYITCGLLIITNPVFISILYYKYLVVPYFMAPLFIVFGMYLIVNFSFSYAACGSLCIFAGLAGYAATLSMIPVFLSLWAFLLIKQWDGRTDAFKYLCCRFLRCVLFSLFGIVLFLIVQKILMVLGLSAKDDYHLRHFNFSEIILKAPETIIFSFKHFFITQPFFPFEYKLSIVMVIFMGFLFSTIESIGNAKTFVAKVVKLFCALFFLFSAIIFCKTAALFNYTARLEMGELRFAAFTMPFVCAFFYLMLYSGANIVRKCAFAVACVCIILGTLNIFYAQRVWKMGYDKELSMYTRVVERIVTHKNYDNTTQYTYMQMGLKNFRSDLYKKKYDYHARELLEYPLMAHWYPQLVLRGIEPALHIKHAFDVKGWGGHGQSLSSSLELRKKYKSEIGKMKPWPHADSVLVIDDVIFVAVEPDMLKKYQDISK